MKFSLVKVIGAVAGLCMVQLAGAQAPEPYHQLSVQEFAGVPQLNSGDMVAYSNCFIDFNYHAKSEKGVYRLTCDIKLVFNRDRSWINKKRATTRAQIEEILNHEQGHYAIAYMEQQELIRTVSKTRFDANYQYEASNIFDRVHEKYKQLSLDYDEDTAHMLNHQQQHSWDEYFRKRVEYMPRPELARN